MVHIYTPGDRLIVPDGKKTGCLPRKSRYGDVCRLLSDAIKVFPRDRWKEFIGKVSLWPHSYVTLDQDGAGSCATESTAGGVMTMRSCANQPRELLNPWSIYRVTSGGVDNGSSIDENLQFARDIGILPEAYWPRSKGWKATPPSAWKTVAAKYKIDEFFDIGTVAEVGTALVEGFVVIFGWEGHSCYLIELVSETTARFKNSWGAWGDKGTGLIDLSAINFGYGAFAIRSVVDSNQGPVP
jgi:hypothetical protein